MAYERSNKILLALSIIECCGQQYRIRHKVQLRIGLTITITIEISLLSSCIFCFLWTEFSSVSHDLLYHRISLHYWHFPKLFETQVRSYYWAVWKMHEELNQPKNDLLMICFLMNQLLFFPFRIDIHTCLPYGAVGSYVSALSCLRCCSPQTAVVSCSAAAQG